MSIETQTTVRGVTYRECPDCGVAMTPDRQFEQDGGYQQVSSCSSCEGTFTETWTPGGHSPKSGVEPGEEA